MFSFCQKIHKNVYIKLYSCTEGKKSLSWSFPGPKEKGPGWMINNTQAKGKMQTVKVA